MTVTDSASSFPRSAGEDVLGEATCPWTCVGRLSWPPIKRPQSPRRLRSRVHFLHDSLQVGGRAAMTRLQASGAASPLLNGA
jgi:hypothetical protein